MKPLVSEEPISMEQYQNFEGMDGVKDELIFGKIMLSPTPTIKHQLIARNLCDLLNRPLAGTPYLAERESSIRFERAQSMPEPDVFVAVKEDLLEAARADIYLSKAPVLVAKILSPANRKKLISEKIELYLANGVAAV